MANGNDGNSGTPPGLSPEALEALAEAQKERNRLLTKTDEKLKELRQNESEYNNLLRLQAEAIEKNTTLHEEDRKRLEELDATVGKRIRSQKVLNDLNETGNTILDNTIGTSRKAFESINGLATAVLELANQFDGAATELGKTTGYVESFNDDIIKSAKATEGFSMSMAEASAVIGGLSTNMTMFNTLSDQQRLTVEKTSLALNRLGVSAEAQGQALDVLTHGMNLTADAAVQATRDFDTLAQKVGLPTSQVIDDFNAIAPQLSRFGSRGKQVFAELTKQARSMGITVQEAFDIAEAFDTFESAAELAGKLNAQIGLQLNSVQLMNASHEDRIKILQSEFKMRGKNFDDMSRRQQQAIAEVMGVDVDMASRIFGDPIALRKYQREQKGLEERAKAVTTVSEDLKNIMQELALTFGPLIKGIREVLKFISGNNYAKWLLFSGLIYKLGSNFKMVQAGVGLLKGKLKDFAGTLTKGMSNPLKGAAEGMDDLATGTDKAGSAAKSNLGSMLGMAAVIAAIGAAVYLAATGVGNLVAAFKGMGAEAMAAVAGIVAFGFAMTMIIPALVGLGTFGWPGVAALIALGAAMLAMGFATKLVVDSLAGLITSLSFLTLEKGAAIAASLAMIGGSFILFSKAATLAGVSSVFVFKLSGALLALGGALYFVGPALEKLGTVFVSGLSATGEIAKGIGDIFSGLADVSVMHIIKVAGAMGILKSAMTDLLDIDNDKAAALTGVLGALAGAGANMENFVASAESLKALEGVVKVSAQLDEANVASFKAIMQATAPVTPPAAPAAGAATKKMTIPINFNIDDTAVASYVINVVENKFDVTRIK